MGEKGVARGDVAREEGAPLLNHRPCLNFARPGIGCNDDAAGGSLAFKEFETGGYRPLGEEPLAIPHRDGENFEPELIYQIVLQKGLDEIATAVNL